MVSQRRRVGTDAGDAEIIILIGSHNMLTTPSRAQLDDPQLRPLIDELLSGADGTPAEERAAVFRLV